MAFALILTLLLSAVVYGDVTRYIIPNWLNAAFLLLYPVFVLLSPHPVPWLEGLAVFAAAFTLGIAVLMLKWMGGGDVKLLSVCGLWCGTAALMDFLLFTAVLGGVLSLLLLLLRPAVLWFAARNGAKLPLPRLLTVGEKVPYGVAIAGGMLAVLWMGGVPGLGFPEF